MRSTSRWPLSAVRCRRCPLCNENAVVAAPAQIVSGEKSIDGEKGVDQELLELGFSDKSNPYPNAPVGQWSTGLCDCFEHFPSCFTACCFPCITVGQVRCGGVSYVLRVVSSTRGQPSMYREFNDTMMNVCFSG